MLLARRRSRISLVEFCELTHHNWQTNWHHREIAAALEQVAEGKIKRLIVQAPPRTGKSELTSRRFPAWYLGRYPHKQVFVATYSDELSIGFGRDPKRILHSEEYHKLFTARVLIVN